jgi:putative peptidoglycan lipid II flippase
VPQLRFPTPSLWLVRRDQVSLLRTTAALATFSVINLLGLALQDVVVAARFGTHDAVGAFVLAHSIPKQVFTIVAGSVVTALIPTLVSLREKRDIHASQQLVSSVAGLSLSLFATLAVLLAASAFVVITHLLPTTERESKAVFIDLLFILVPSVPIHGLAIVWLGVINASTRVQVAAAAPAVVPIVAVASLVLFGQQAGIFALAWGSVLGYLAQLALLGVALRMQRFHLRPYPVTSSSELRAVLRHLGAAVAGVGLISAAGVVDQLFAASLGPRAVAALSYGSKVPLVLIAVANASLGASTLPFLSTLVADRQFSVVRQSVRTLTIVVVLVTVPAAAFVFMTSSAIVALAFERGAFTHADSLLVSDVQTFYALQLPPYVLSLLFMRTLSSLGQNHVLAFASLVFFLANVACDYLFIRTMGVSGLALATAATYLIFCVCLGGAVWSRTRQPDGTSGND